MSLSPEELSAKVSAIGLTKDEVGLLRSLVTSPSWTALGKVWGWQADQMREACTTARDDHRFVQGVVYGHKAARLLVDQLSKPPVQSVDLSIPVGVEPVIVTANANADWSSFTKKYARVSSSGSAADFDY